MIDCPFCEIATGQAAAAIVYQTTSVIAFFPDAPAVRGHTLVVPKQHVADFLQAGAEVTAEVAVAATVVGRALDSVLQPEGINVITSARAAATQTVMHLHLHVLPRWMNDRLRDPCPRIKSLTQLHSKRWPDPCVRSSGRPRRRAD